MSTNLQIDSRLVVEAVNLGHHKTKKAAVIQALIEYTQHLRQLKIKELFRTIDIDPDYDYRKQLSIS